MANLCRVRTEWTGSAVVGGGLSTFYFDEADTGFIAGLNTFWDSLKALIPAGTTLTTHNTGDLVDVATGGISGSWTDGTTSVVNATAAGVYPGGVGARVKWFTNGIVNGKRVRGGTFICPLIGTAFDGTGTINTSPLSTMQTSANTFLGTGGFTLNIWHRPVSGSGGSAHAVTYAQVPDAVSWLRSRRT